MSEHKKLTPTWGYHCTEDPKIHHLAEGENLPKGWHDHPDKAKQPEPKSQGQDLKLTAIEGDKTK